MRNLFYRYRGKEPVGEGHVVLFANGEFEAEGLDVDRVKEAFVSAVDGGVRWCKAIGAFPQVILGDFDSVPDTLLSEYTHAKWVKKENQELTDLEFAVDFFLKQDGVRRVTCLGGLGGRVDHTLANFLVASRYPLQVCFETSDGFHFMANRSSGTVIVEAEKGQTVSFFPISGSSRVETKGLEWELVKSKPLNNRFFSQSNVAEGPFSLVVATGAVHVCVNLRI